MQKMIRNILMVFSLTLIFMVSEAQTSADISSMGFNYSALVRDTAGRVTPNKLVKMRFSILNSQGGGAPAYQETQTPTTDAYGFANVTIGQGSWVAGTITDFTLIDFTSRSYWLMIEVYNNFTQSYDPLAKQAMRAVPYAKVAYKSVYGGVPAGTIVAFGGNVNAVPTGWVICDGSAVSATDTKYINLYNAIGTAWGSPASGQFNIPDFRGLFMRGASNGSGTDLDSASRTPLKTGGNGGAMVGSYQGDIFQGHTHRTNITISCTDEWAGSGPTYGLGVVYGHPYDPNWQNVFLNSNTDNGIGANGWGGSETRPKNVYVNYIIKL